MEPRIQFCTSADGTRIGYGTRGERNGTPLVYVKAFFMSEKVVWDGPYRPGGELLSRGRFWVSGDRRGVGASQRDVDDLGLEHQIADLDAVVEHAGIDQFDLVGYWDGAAEAGNDVINCGDGNDVADGGPGVDVVWITCEVIGGVP